MIIEKLVLAAPTISEGRNLSGVATAGFFSETEMLLKYDDQNILE